VAFGGAYLAWDIRLTLANGLQLASGLMAVFASAALYQGYALWKRNLAVRWSAFLSAVVLSICLASIAYILISLLIPLFPQSVQDLPAEIKSNLVYGRLEAW
jgi:uncharacterized membrane protein (DUF2068 family)